MVHRCVINSLVMWLHIAVVGPGCCVYVAMFGSKTIICAFVVE